jgi:hypothetical protein
MLRALRGRVVRSDIYTALSGQGQSDAEEFCCRRSLASPGSDVGGVSPSQRKMRRGPPSRVSAAAASASGRRADLTPSLPHPHRAPLQCGARMRVRARCNTRAPKQSTDLSHTRALARAGGRREAAWLAHAHGLPAAFGARFRAPPPSRRSAAIARSGSSVTQKLLSPPPPRSTARANGTTSSGADLRTRKQRRVQTQPAHARTQSAATVAVGRAGTSELLCYL